MNTRGLDNVINADSQNKWPKRFPPLTPEQARISDDFMRYWHEVLPRRYGIVERFNHSYVVGRAPKHFARTLEIGAGLGEHLAYEHLDGAQAANYYALELRDNMASELARRFPDVNAVVGDCQKRLDFEDGFFDRIIAVHVLEHLADLPAAIRELHRVCDKRAGTLSIVIPCEGSLAYSLARRISARRVFEARYRQSYDWFIEREHINVPSEIFEELSPYFEHTSATYFPFPVPLEFCNLCIGATFVPRIEPRVAPGGVTSDASR